jgi:HlyD family secretion protein
VSVRIVTASVGQAVLAPLGALFPHGKGMAVYRMEGHQARLQPVELGGRNASEAWVRSGLEAGQAVIIYPSSNVREGRRVSVRTP